MSCGWEGNRRSVVTLTMHHRLQWFIQAHGLRKGDEHPTYTPHGTLHLLSHLTSGDENTLLSEQNEHTYLQLFYKSNINSSYKKIKCQCNTQCLQCFDADGWAAGRASGL